MNCILIIREEVKIRYCDLLRFVCKFNIDLVELENLFVFYLIKDFENFEMGNGIWNVF